MISNSPTGQLNENCCGVIPGCSVDLLEFPVWTRGGMEKEKVTALESKCRNVQESGFQLTFLSFLGTVSTNYPNAT